MKFDVRQGSKLNSYLLSEEGWVSSSLVRSFVTGMTPNFNSYTRSNSELHGTRGCRLFSPPSGERLGFRSSLSISDSHARSPTFQREKFTTFSIRRGRSNDSSKVARSSVTNLDRRGSKIDWKKGEEKREESVGNNCRRIHSISWTKGFYGVTAMGTIYTEMTAR